MIGARAPFTQATMGVVTTPKPNGTVAFALVVVVMLVVVVWRRCSIGPADAAGLDAQAGAKERKTARATNTAKVVTSAMFDGFN